MIHGMMHSVFRNHRLTPGEIITPRVEVSLKPWEVTARYLDPQAMSGQKNIAGGH